VDPAPGNGFDVAPTRGLRPLIPFTLVLLGVGYAGASSPGKDGAVVVGSDDPVGTWGEAQPVVGDGVVVYERDGG